MKFQFTTDLDHQKDAVAAVVRALAEQPRYSSETTLSHANNKRLFSEPVIPNPLPLDRTLLLENIRAVQQHNNLPLSPKLETTKNSLSHTVPNLSIDMETGTGKTYVYLKTMLELAQRYGYRKFIVITPSIAVREGLLTAISLTQAHFRETYDPFESFAYNAKNLAPVRNFAQSQHLQLMIINIQAFVRDFTQNSNTPNPNTKKRSNIIYRAADRFEGRSPLHFLRATRPLLILDEPQSIDTTDNAQRAIAKLDPALILRYSATHKTPYNLLYRLDPVQAYEKGLVKKITIASVTPENYHNKPLIRILDLKDIRGTPKALLQFEQQNKDTFKQHKQWVEDKDDLYTLSGDQKIYEGYIVQEINRRKGYEYIEFKNGEKLSKGESSGSIGDEHQRQQIIECVDQHFRKILEVKNQPNPVKVLSLFFIDKVAHYRGAESNDSKGKFALWFEEAFATCQAQPQYKNLISHPADEVHNGYFAQDNRGKRKDKEGNPEEQKRAYRLIMQLKEQLLSPQEPLQFIFSHSALKEGWDNPNVFQICTLNETVSEQKKRQEIGRGMRLPVNCKGERIKDPEFNRLTVVTNEAYEEFANALQKEFKGEDGRTIPKPLSVKKETILKRNEETFASKRFWDMWNSINLATRYHLSLDEKQIIEKSVKKILGFRIDKPTFTITEGNLDPDKEESSPYRKATGREISISSMPEILLELQEKTSLPRNVLYKILKRSECMEKIKNNPEVFLQKASQQIQEVMKDFLVEGIRYTKTEKGRYNANVLFPPECHVVRDLVYKVINKSKSLYDHIVCDAGSEETAAKKFDIGEETKVFIKLPRKFVVHTPVGDYNPDWAIVQDEGEQVDLVKVVETKGSDRESDRRGTENQKTNCAKKHFEALGIPYTIEGAKTSQS